jgi:hypothetical protein
METATPTLPKVARVGLELKIQDQSTTATTTITTVVSLVTRTTSRLRTKG